MVAENKIKMHKHTNISFGNISIIKKKILYIKVCCSQWIIHDCYIHAHVYHKCSQNIKRFCTKCYWYLSSKEWVLWKQSSHQTWYMATRANLMAKVTLLMIICRWCCSSHNVGIIVIIIRALQVFSMFSFKCPKVDCEGKEMLQDMSVSGPDMPCTVNQQE